jgi:hypothetical protein
MTESKVVSASGTATIKSRSGEPNEVELAMSNAVLEASKEAEAIAADGSLTPEQRQAKIKEITSDKAILARKLKARADIADRRRAEAAAAQKKAAEDEVLAAAAHLDKSREKK